MSPLCISWTVVASLAVKRQAIMQGKLYAFVGRCELRRMRIALDREWWPSRRCWVLGKGSSIPLPRGC